MSATSNPPTNPNPLSPINFRFSLQRAPNLMYFCQAASVPELSLGEPLIENVFVKLPTPGDKLTYSPLNIRFQVDENLTDWLEIHDWMVGLGFPESYDQSIHRDPRDNLNNAQFNNSDIFSDGTLVINTSARNPNIRVLFKDLFPISLSTLDFDLTQPDITYLEADVSFGYRSYTIESINA